MTIDGEKTWDNSRIKQALFFLPDDPWFFPNSNAQEMEDYYDSVYPLFDRERFHRLLSDFSLDPKRSVNGYSKGMRKQLAVICGLCSGTQYLLCDETFDGLDPVMRQAVKSLFAQDMEERSLTPVIASHNLRELEDICDHVGLLHKGGLLLSEDLEAMKLGLQKLQFVPEREEDAEKMLSSLDILKQETRGRLRTAVVRGTREEVLTALDSLPTVYQELLPLSLEEIFISETEVVGYDVKKLILG